MKTTTFRCLTALVFSGLAAAGPIIDFTGGEVELNDGNQTYGYSFTVSSPITVDGLGVFDSFAQGIGTSHEVGLWNSGGTLLASTAVTGADPIVASTDTLGQWLEQTITPVVLGPGEYFAGAFYTAASENVLVLGTPGSVPGITYDSAQFNFGDSLTFPSTEFATTLVGPAVFTSAAPEPATIALLVSGLAGIACLRLRKRQNGGAVRLSRWPALARPRR